MTNPAQHSVLTLGRQPALALALICALTMLATPAALAQTFTVLYDFTGRGDGAQPYAGITLDGAGNLYGTTVGSLVWGGTVFQLKHTDDHWILNTLASLGSADPMGRVVFGSNGALYGTTLQGGSDNCLFGCGTVYNLQRSCITAGCPWTVTFPYSFTGGEDGRYPFYVDPVFDQAGNLYGTAAGGGSAGDGVVFKLTPSGGGWTESVIHNFTGGDGEAPESGVIFDSAGNLYGTTLLGGLYGNGTVFRLTRSGSNWVASTLYSFRGGTDGLQPVGGLVVDRSGNLYGTTTGGTGTYGNATVFELSPSGGGWTFTLLYGWGDRTGGPEGNLAMDAAGNLYGAVSAHGAFGYGSVFKLTPSGSGWTYTDLHDFTGYLGSDGADPVGGPTLDADGNVYGTTLYGGITAGFSGCAYGCGVVWKVTP